MKKILVTITLGHNFCCGLHLFETPCACYVSLSFAYLGFGPPFNPKKKAQTKIKKIKKILNFGFYDVVSSVSVFKGKKKDKIKAIFDRSI